MPFWLAVVLGFFVVARTVRFVNSDVLAEPIRMWADGIETSADLTRRPRWRKIKRTARRPLRAIFGDDLPVLFSCPWCLSIWVAFPVAVAVVALSGDFGAWGNVWAVAGLWLGYSYLYGLAALNLDD